MKFATFHPLGQPDSVFPGRIEGDRLVRLLGASLIDCLTAAQPVAEGESYPLSEVQLLAPIPNPPAVRDFIAFEKHIATARGRRGAEVPSEWYQFPTFYFSNPASIVGPDVLIKRPAKSTQLDYELEVAAVIGLEGKILGFTIMNDWSARDLQAAEMKIGLGPAKGKDFATSMGPVLVTPDEFDGTSAAMVARINGEERSRGNLSEIHYPWAALVAHASENTHLRPGDIIGSGTVGSGCILEHGDGRWLQPGDVVELEVEGIGILRNQIA